MLSFGLIDSRGKLTNAGALLADKSPIRWSRLFCTRWNGLTKGGGLSRIIEGYQKAYNYSGDKKPEFESSRVEFTVTFKNLNYGKNEDFDTDGVETGKSGVETAKNGVESGVETDKNIIEMNAEEKIINLLKLEPKLSQKIISQRLNIPYRTLQRIMEKMVTTGKIRREGAARGGYWEVL
jgi:predicted HTH transcriptional regulator